MKKPANDNPKSPDHYFLRLWCFLLFGTVGMASIGTGILAPPLAGYYADRQHLRIQQDHYDYLQDLYNKQEEMLANQNDPAVIERDAINYLNYRPAQALSAEVAPLPEVWPDLEKALSGLDRQPPPLPQSRLGRYAEILTEKPFSRIMLVAIGSALVLISLTFFNRKD